MIAERGVPGFAIAEPARHGFEGLEADPPSAANAEEPTRSPPWRGARKPI